MTIIRLIKLLSDLSHAVKAMIIAFKNWTFKRREKQLELALDEAKKDKNTEKLQKKIGELLE